MSSRHFFFGSHYFSLMYAPILPFRSSRVLAASTLLISTLPFLLNDLPLSLVRQVHPLSLLTKNHPLEQDP